jgi:putative thioredoxin
MGMSVHAVDVTEATFETDVIQRSMEVPVVVDFWADWCAPCHALAPVLERAVEARNGDVVLARVDVDANPMLAQVFQVQGIPAVKAISQGRLVGEFVGAQPPPYVERFLDSVAPRRTQPAPAPAASAQEAAAAWRATLEEDPDNVQARVGLATLGLREGRIDEAEELLRPVAQAPEAERLASTIRLLRVAADESSPFAVAARQATDGAPGEALARLLGSVRASIGGDRDRARELMLDVFRVLGDGDPLTQRYRRELMTALF